MQEITKAVCANDPVTFINDWVWTYDPRIPAHLPFQLFPKQEEFIRWLQERERLQESGVIEKSRDSGITYVCCAYAVWCWLFRPADSTGFGSRKENLVDTIGDPDSIFEKIRMILRYLPHWMLPKGFKFNQHDGFCKIINPENEATITGEAGDNIGRGGRKSRYFVDEKAFIERTQKVDAALSQTTRVQIDISTPNGTGNTFYKRRHSGNIPVFTFHWRDDPRKDDAWYASEKKRLDDPVVVAQELDIDYSASIEGVCIPAAWVRAAVGLELPRSERKVGGLDVADEGRNRNVLIAHAGPVVTDVVDWNQHNTTQTAHRAVDEAEKRGVSLLHYDSDGVGAGVKGTVQSTERKMRVQMVALSGGASPTETKWPDGRTSKERFLNYRAEMWWILRTRFERTYEFVVEGIPHPPEDLISLPNHPTLIAQLSTPLYVTTETGKIKIESKVDMRKRGIESPDFADSLAYAFAPAKPPERATVNPGMRSAKPAWGAKRA